MTTYEGRLDAAGLRIAIVVSRFNETITRQLLEGARDCLRRHGADDRALVVAWVPGAFEIPLAAQRLARSGQFDAVICLGAVIRGATAHFEHVAGQAAAGVARVALETGIPVTFGILTTDTIEQALERSGIKAGNKGFDAAMAAMEMANLLSHISAD
jgi:6,7-dimethyl-8-ribityllumazine synthase